MRVVPAILTDDTRELERLVMLAETFTSYVQFDIMDGHFVPSRSIGSENIAELRTKLNWEAHLMVLHPETYLDGFHGAGASKITFHYEATSSPREVISIAGNMGLEVGLAINPETPVSAVIPLCTEIDSVLILSVHPGFYGKEFIPEILGKIAEIRAVRPEVEIGIDGGIKESNIAKIAESGADVAYVGSGIFMQPQPSETCQRLLAIAQGAMP